MADLNPTNLSKSRRDFGKDYFWSRAWENSGYDLNDISFKYPLLSIIETSQLYHFNTAGKPRYDATISLEIAVIDQYKEDCKDCPNTYCNNRTIQEIERDTGKLLSQSIFYLSEIQAYTLNDSSEIQYLHPKHVKWLLDNDHIEDYTKDTLHTTAWEESMRQFRNQNVRGFRLRIGADMGIGSFIQGQFKEFSYCESIEPSFYLPSGFIKELGCDC